MAESVQYSVLPIEPTFFARSIDVKIGTQIPNINPVDLDFASLAIDKTNVPDAIITYLDQPIKSTSPKAKIISYSLTKKAATLIPEINADSHTSIELKDVPSFVTNYSDYQGFLLNFISQIQSKNIYLNTPYATDVIQNISKYAIKGLIITQFGVCTKSKPEIQDVFHYFIDTDVLRTNVAALKDVEMIVQADLICSPIQGISNTFGSQLWLYDFLFQLATANVKKAFVDMATFNNIYTVMAFSYATRMSALLYAPIINYQSVVKPNIPIYITKNNTEYLISVVHKDIAEENVQINLTMPIYTPGQLVRYLCNQTIIGEYGITFGELTFDGVQVSGNNAGLPINAHTKAPSTKFVTSNIIPINGVYTFVVNKMSIAVLRIPLVAGGAYFENINDSDEGRTIVTVEQNPLEIDSIPTTMSIKQFKKDKQMLV